MGSGPLRQRPRSPPGHGERLYSLTGTLVFIYDGTSSPNEPVYFVPVVLGKLLNFCFHD